MTKIDIQVSVAGVQKAIADLNKLGQAGPHRNVQRAMEQATAASLIGSPMQRADAGIRLQRAQRALAKATGGGGGGALGKLSGLLEEWGAISAAGGVLAAFTTAVKSATDALITMSNAGIMSGGTPRDVAFLAGMGMQNIPGRATSFRHALASDPFARAAAMQLGVSPGQMMPTMMGTQNFAAGMRQALEGLRRVTNAEERLRKARMVGMEDQLPLLAASTDAWNNLMASISRLESVQKGASRTMSDLQANMQAFKNNVTSLQTFSDVAAGLNVVLGYLNKHFTDINVFFTLFFRAVGDLMGGLLGLLTRNPGMVTKAFNDIKNVFDPAEVKKLYGQLGAAADAQQKAADAQNNAAGAMGLITQGMFGGGSRFRDAVTGGMLNPQMDAWSFRMGAFGF